MGRSARLFVAALGLCAGLCAQPTTSFRNDIIPALTKLGCNSGQCHGSQFGKGGFKLSLLGFEVEADYDAIVKDVKGRRINLASLAESLILRKPTLSIPHGGGRRFAIDSPAYNLLLTWLAAGAPAPRRDDAMLQAVESLPRSRTMQAGEKFPLKVVARFSNGDARV